MKLLILVIVLMPAVLCDPEYRRDEYIATAAEHGRVCQAESGVSQEVLDSIRSGNDDNDPKYKDSLFCFLKRMELQEQNGDVIIENFRQLITGHFSPARVEQIIEQCATKKGDNPSETAYLFIKCYGAFAPADHASPAARLNSA